MTSVRERFRSGVVIRNANARLTRERTLALARGLEWPAHADDRTKLPSHLFHAILRRDAVALVSAGLSWGSAPRHVTTGPTAT